jgi:DNA-directed RNA polymerase specialized sigma24 family protein
MVATPDEVDEQAPVEAARRDRARFVELYDRHFHRVYAYAIRRTGNRADAEDVTSKVFRRARANLDRYRGAASGSPWGCTGLRIMGWQERLRAALEDALA